MLKLTKTESAELDRHCQAMVEKYQALLAAVETFNEALAQAWTAVEKAQDDYNNVVADCNDWRLQLGADGREYFEERSEKWQASEKGQAYAAWLEPYEDEYLFPQSELECPEPLDVDVDDPEDGMGSLAIEPE